MVLAQWAVAMVCDDAARVVGGHRQGEDLGEVGDPLGFQEAARVAQVGMEDVASLVDDEVLETLPPARFSPVQIGTLEAATSRFQLSA